MKRTASALFSLAMLAALIMTAGCPEPGKKDIKMDAPPPPAYSIEDLTRVRYSSRVSFLAPPDWKIIKRRGNPVMFAISPGGEKDGPLANLVIENISQRMAPDEYLRANILSMRVSIDGLEFIKGGIETIRDRPTAWVRYKFPREGATIEALAYCRTVDYKAYVLTATAPDEEFESIEPLFRTMGRSLQAD